MSPLPDAGPDPAPLTFPDLPRLELDQLLAQLVERAQEVMGAQGRLRALLCDDQVVGGEPAPADVLQHTVAAARDLVGARYAALGVIGPGGGLAGFVHEGMDAETVARIGRLPQGKGMLGALIDGGQPIRLPTIADDPRSSGLPSGHPPMVGGFLGVPIRIGDEVFGILYLVGSTHGREFSAKDEELLVALAAAAAVNIDCARLYASGRARGEWLAASIAVTRQLLATVGDAGIHPWQLIAERTRDIAGADVVVVLRPGADGTVAELVIEVGVGPGGAELRGQRVPVAGSMSGRVYSTGEPARTGQVVGGIGPAAVMAGEVELGPALAVPLIGPGRVHGVLTAARRAGRPGFSPADLQMAGSFGNDAALAIELAEARAEQELGRILADRERIAADLHDQVIERLFATGLSLHTAAAIARDAPMRGRLDTAIESLDGAIRQIRTTIFQLKAPPRQGDQGVRGRLLAVVADVRPALGFDPGLQFSGLREDTLPSAVVEDLVEVLREALTNVARHAGARTAEVDVTSTGGRLVLQVADDGGKPGSTGRRSGLANMRRRAEAHGGVLEILPVEPTGTTLCWSVPVG